MSLKCRKKIELERDKCWQIYGQPFFFGETLSFRDPTFYRLYNWVSPTYFHYRGSHYRNFCLMYACTYGLDLPDLVDLYGDCRNCGLHGPHRPLDLLEVVKRVNFFIFFDLIDLFDLLNLLNLVELS